MPRKLRQLRKDLLDSGAYIASQKGSHQRWKHPTISDVCVLAGKDSSDADYYQEKDVKRFLEALRREHHD